MALLSGAAISRRCAAVAVRARLVHADRAA